MSAETSRSSVLEAPAPAASPRATTTGAPPPATKRVRLGRLVFIVLVLAAIGVAAGLWPRLQQRQAVAQDTKELAVPTVITVKAEPAPAPEPMRLSVELKPFAEASLYARANGYVKRWLVDLGARVEEGQLLAELDTPEIDRELAEAKADVRQAEAAEKLAQATAERWQQLLKQKTVSPQETDEKTGDLAVRQAALESSIARVSRLQELVGFAKITAPFAGIVTRRQLDVGQLVNAGSGTELYRITQNEKLRAFVRVPQSLAHLVKIGSKAELLLPDAGSKPYPATVVRTAGAVEASSRTLLVELEVDNAKGELLAGSYAQMRLHDTRPAPAMTLPANTLLFRAEGPQVGIVKPDNHVELRSIEIGRDLGMRIEVAKGVGPEDQVILNPPDALVNGIEVRVQKPEDKAPAAPAAH